MVINDGVQSSCEFTPDCSHFYAVYLLILTDDAGVVDGAPCAIQVITSRFQDEKRLYAARVIDQDIR